MKTLITLLAIVSIIFTVSCDHSNDINAEMLVRSLICYPDDVKSLEFELAIEAENEPYSLQWIHPDTFKGPGPFKVNLMEDLQLEVIITDAEDNRFEFNHLIQTDTIDSLKYDYRSVYCGHYEGEVLYHNGGSSYWDGETYDPSNDTTYYDKIFLSKHEDFGHLKIGNAYLRFDYKVLRFKGNRKTGWFYSSDSIYCRTFTGPGGEIDIWWDFRGRKIR